MRILSGLGVLVVALSCWGLASADAPARTDPQQENADVLRASTLLDKEVQSSTGERFGQVKDIVIDRSGVARYVVVAYGGFLGMGDKLTAVPWDTARITPDKEKVILHVSKDVLTQAPTFTAESWPKLVDSDWSAQVDRYYRTAQAEADAEPVFVLLDRDDDGQISRTEATRLPSLGERFSELDMDRDGTLSRSEFSAFEAVQEEQ